MVTVVYFSCFYVPHIWHVAVTLDYKWCSHFMITQWKTCSDCNGCCLLTAVGCKEFCLSGACRLRCGWLCVLLPLSCSWSRGILQLCCHTVIDCCRVWCQSITVDCSRAAYCYWLQYGMMSVHYCWLQSCCQSITVDCSHAVRLTVDCSHAVRPLLAAAWYAVSPLLLTAVMLETVADCSMAWCNSVIVDRKVCCVTVNCSG